MIYSIVNEDSIETIPIMSFIIIKPDAYSRGLMGEILTRFERRGFRVRSIWTSISVDNFPDKISEHYREHADKGFYQNLRRFMMSGTCVFIVFKGEATEETVKTCREITMDIRKDYQTSTGENCVHASDSVAAYEREVALWKV